jgi:hypothetical protein
VAVILLVHVVLYCTVLSFCKLCSTQWRLYCSSKSYCTLYSVQSCHSVSYWQHTVAVIVLVQVVLYSTVLSFCKLCSTQWRLYCSSKSYCTVQSCHSVSCAAHSGGYIVRPSRTVQFCNSVLGSTQWRLY